MSAAGINRLTVLDGKLRAADVLALNKLLDDNAALDAATLSKVRMPNRDGFIIRFPDRI